MTYELKIQKEIVKKDIGLAYISEYGELIDFRYKTFDEYGQAILR